MSNDYTPFRIGIDTVTMNEVTKDDKQRIIRFYQRLHATSWGFLLKEHTGFVRMLAAHNASFLTYTGPGLIVCLLGLLWLLLGHPVLFLVFMLVGLAGTVAGTVLYWAYFKSEERYSDDLDTRKELLNQHDAIAHISAQSLSAAAEHALPELKENGWPVDEPIPARWMGVSIGTCHGVKPPVLLFR